MLLARVIGQVWGARQAPNLAGHRLLLLRPLGRRADGGHDDAPIDASADAPGLGERGDELVAIDQLGAGPGELVLVAHGSRCRDLTLGPAVPTKEIVLAIVDRAHLPEVAR